VRVGSREEALKTRAETLLKSVIDGGVFTVSQVARELDVSPHDVDLLATGKEAMTLAQQLSLAKFVIENAPSLARRGHTLRSQVSAAVDFHAHKTSTHKGPPARWPRDR
jgi:hypothetical protein